VPRASPPCPRCGGPRLFEFQILPQLIGLLPGLPVDAAGDAGLDFGVIAVYTCARSCSLATPDGGGPYAEEWAWVQPTLDEKGEAELEATRRLLLGGGGK
jgi:pre-rRNA-processing protein TSR4